MFKGLFVLGLRIIRSSPFLSPLQCVRRAEGKAKNAPGGSCTKRPDSKFTSHTSSPSSKNPT